MFVSNPPEANPSLEREPNFGPMLLPCEMVHPLSASARTSHVDRCDIDFLASSVLICDLILSVSSQQSMRRPFDVRIRKCCLATLLDCRGRQRHDELCRQIPLTPPVPHQSRAPCPIVFPCLHGKTVVASRILLPPATCGETTEPTRSGRTRIRDQSSATINNTINGRNRVFRARMAAMLGAALAADNT